MSMYLALCIRKISKRLLHCLAEQKHANGMLLI